MSVHVCVWAFDWENENVGHTSLLIQGRGYISWFPDKSITFAMAVTNVYPSRHTPKDDLLAEGKKPDFTVDLTGLDEDAMVEWWAGFGLNRGKTYLEGPLPPYNLSKLNCSTVVARALKAGGGERLASWSKSHNLVWTPKKVYEFARSIKKNTIALPE